MAEVLQAGAVQANVMGSPQGAEFLAAKIIHPTDAILRLSATCVCGSDLWRYRGIKAVDGPTHGVQFPGEELFYAEVHLHGGPAPVRRFLPELVRLIKGRAIDPGKVFDLTLSLSEAAEGHRAMGERRAIKALLRP